MAVLTAAQFKMLTLPAPHPGWVYSREQIMGFARNGEAGSSWATDMHISNIRKAIEQDPENPRYLQTVRGLGYKFSGVQSSRPAKHTA